MNTHDLWNRYKSHLCLVPAVGLSLDISRMHFDDAFFARMAPAMEKAFAAMDALEKGAIANPDENRMVGHYWLRAPELAPDGRDRGGDRETLARRQGVRGEGPLGRDQARAGRPVHARAVDRHRRLGAGTAVRGRRAGHAGNGQAEASLLRQHRPRRHGPRAGSAGQARSPRRWSSSSARAATPETRNGMLVVAEAFRQAGLDFARHAVAVTGAGSKLDQQAEEQDGWRGFPMWDWVGGRTSELSAVGLLPGVLQGLDIDGMLAGAAAMDVATRAHDTAKNPAALLALMWYHATGGKGEKDMVVLPYKDRLLLFSRYLQQLVMESLGKRLDLDGKRVDQGISVYGNKGSTDQHAYVQQLRDGVNNFFVTFIACSKTAAIRFEVEPGVTPGDYPPRLSAGHPRGPLRQRPPVDHDHRAPGRRPHRRCADRPVRAGGRLLRLACQHQRLSSAGRRGRQEGGGGGARSPGEGPGVALRRRPRRPSRSPRRSARATPPRRSTWCSSTLRPTDEPGWSRRISLV